MSIDSYENKGFNLVAANFYTGYTLVKSKDYEKALPCLTKTITLDSRYVQAYILRSLVYLRLTELGKAMADAEAALALEKRNPKAILLTGEISYQRGDFEEALTIFHRGNSLRPTVSAFQIGIYKCEAAIKNSCGPDININLTKDVDLTDFYTRAFPPKKKKEGRKISSFHSKQQKNEKSTLEWPSSRPSHLQRQLMRHTYKDFCYLNELFECEQDRINGYVRSKRSSKPIKSIETSRQNMQIIHSCAKNLDQKTELWYMMDPGLRQTGKE